MLAVSLLFFRQAVVYWFFFLKRLQDEIFHVFFSCKSACSIKKLERCFIILIISKYFSFVVPAKAGIQPNNNNSILNMKNRIIMLVLRLREVFNEKLESYSLDPRLREDETTRIPSSCRSHSQKGFSRDLNLPNLRLF